jgi:hypothetical protein
MNLLKPLAVPGVGIVAGIVADAFAVSLGFDPLTCLF